jgi:hypothetical protein
VSVAYSDKYASLQQCRIIIRGNYVS